MFRLISRLYFRLAGWKLVGNFDDAPAKYIVVVMPHTANFDFFLGLMTRSQLDIGESKFLGKSQLFKPPFGFLFRWLGGHPVDRTKDNNLVDAVVRIFNEHDEFAIALAPEGTRSKVERIKTGFYHIASKAKVAIIPVAFDYGQKEVVVGKPFYTTHSMADDFRVLATFFEGKYGKYPDLGVGRAIIENSVTSVNN